MEEDVKELATNLHDLLVEGGLRKYLKDLAYELQFRQGRSYLAEVAEKTIRRVNPRENVLMVTGFRVPPNYIQETDGPLGTAVLYRALLKLGAFPVVVTEAAEESVRCIYSALETLGFRPKVINGYEVPNDLGREPTVIAAPPQKERGSQQFLRNMWRYLNPAAVVFIEKPGPNTLGIYHSMGGLDITQYHIDAEILLKDLGRSAGVTIGIGDGGNEVGMGVVYEAVRKYVPYGSICRCPCRGGIATYLRTDFLVLGSNSNRGAYALAEVIMSLTGVGEPAVTPEEVLGMLEAVTRSGCVDGFTGKRSVSVDGEDIESITSFVKRMNRLRNKIGFS